jgi:CBS domain-containing protein
MQVRDVATPQPFTLRPHLPARAAAAQLVQRGLAAAPVMDAEGRVRGVVSAADLARGQRAAEDGEAVDRPVVADLMTPSPPTVEPDTDLALVAASLLDAGAQCVPVLDDGRLVGVVSRHALLRALGDAAVATAAPAAGM